MRAITIDDQTRSEIDELLEHRAKVSGDLYLVSVRNVARALIRQVFNRRLGDKRELDYRGPNAALHKYIAETLEKRGAQLWGIGCSSDSTHRQNTWADRIYQVSRGQTK